MTDARPVPGSATAPADVAERLLHLLAERAPTLGAGRLLCVDGPAGSGKTTLAAQVGARTGARVVHMDDLYDGWTGLPRLTDQLAGLLEPLAAGRPGRYRRYDWHAAAYAEEHVVEPGPLLVLEGVGSGAAAYDDLVTVLAWVEAPPVERMRRGLERDGADLEPQWRAWALAEADHLAREGTMGRADVLVDGTGREPPRVRHRRRP